jgi:ABC-type dipeptide/oligopeptide/nickel transport system permease component
LLAYLTRRLGASVLTLWLAVTLAFIALQVIPGDAIAAQLARSGATPAQIAARRTQLGLDEPIFVQYTRTLAGLLRGDFGHSLTSGRSVSETIGEQFGATLVLAMGALAVAVIVGIGLGIGSSASRSRLMRGLAIFLTALILSSPVYWIGTLAIYLFSVGLRLLPSTGSGDDLRFLLLPWLTLGIGISGSIARVTASSLDDTRRADFVRTARGKGLPERQVLVHHVLRVGFGPILAVIALQTGFLLGGTVITEALFVRQGIGQVLLSAIQEKDFPVVQGIVVLSAIIYILVNTTADVLFGALDPRVRSEHTL